MTLRVALRNIALVYLSLMIASNFKTVDTFQMALQPKKEEK